MALKKKMVFRLVTASSSEAQASFLLQGIHKVCGELYLYYFL